MENKRIRCAIYTRKSVEDNYQKEQTSVESQRINCTKFAEARGFEILPTVYEDYGKTGANINRPGFQQLLKDIRSGLIDCVLVYKIDRLTRSLSDFVNVIDGIFKDNNVAFISATESFDTSTPVGTLVMTLLVVFAQFERQQISARVKDKIRTSRTRGIWTGGTVPLGYRSVERKLVINPETQEAVQMIFNEYTKGQSISQIFTLLRERFGIQLTQAGIRYILCNPLYKGCLRHGKEIYKGNHESLISEEVWDQVANRTLAKPPRRAQQDSQALLKGLCHCENCRCLIYAQMTRKAEHKQVYYVCSKLLRKKLCQGSNKYIRAQNLEDLVIREVRRVLKNPEKLEGMMQFLKENTENVADAYQALNNIDLSWESLLRVEQRDILQKLLKKVIIGSSKITLVVSTQNFQELLGSVLIKTTEEREWSLSLEETVKDLVCSSSSRKQNKTDTLLKVLLKAQDWKDEFEQGKFKSVKEFAKTKGVSFVTVYRHWKLFQLSPKIQEAIINETLPPRWTATDFMQRMWPKDWKEQEEFFKVA